MKLKVNDLYDLSLGLDDLADKELGISTALKVQRNQKNVSEELIPTNKIREKIIDKYKDDKVRVANGGVKIKDHKWDIYNKEINELMDQDVELKLEKINIKDLGDISIKPRALTFLSSMLIEKENAE